MRRNINISEKYLRIAAIAFWGVFALLMMQLPATAMAPEFRMEGDEMHVDDAPDTSVVAFGKNVVVNKSAKGVFVMGGDVKINGNVEGDVGVIGGSVTQAKDAFIGGDIIVIGGSYKPEKDHPLRNEGKETVMLGIFEDEIREFARDPSSIFAPALSGAYIAQRLLSILFWFLISIGLATIAPGGISRAVTRLKLSSLKVALFGSLALAAVIFGAVVGVSALPNYISGIAGLMAVILLALAYILGRVTLHVLVGKYIQKHFFGDGFRSEAIAIFVGVVAWTLILSVPYIWTIGVVCLFISGVGLVLTAKAPTDWRTG